MRIITLDDFIDIYAKIKQRGFLFITSKFNFNKIKRTKSAFNNENIESSNWWIIPKIEKRCNKIITGDENLNYEKFVVDNYLKNTKNLKMLSIGSGVCSHELEFASYNIFEKIICIDISDVLLNIAKKKAAEKHLCNINFLVKNIYHYEFPENEFDIVLFHASLHHFEKIETFLTTKINKTLKKNGKLIINEYVGANRLQFPKQQIKAINEALKFIPKQYRKRFKLNLHKNKVYGSGMIRMIVADPSECMESELIIPTIHKHFKTIYEAPYGGNILHLLLKDISHHFLKLNDEKEIILNTLFNIEDSYLKDNKSDFIFGIYENSKDQ